MLVGLACLVIGIAWTWITSWGWRAGWANLWVVVKGGTGLFLLAAALIALLLGLVQVRDERENRRRQEEEKKG
jgi:uncharacterized membrane protein